MEEASLMSSAVTASAIALLSDDLSVRMRVFGMHHPPMGSSSAGNAAQEHRAADAADRVVMTGDVAANPVPHGTFLFQNRRPADGKGSASL
jgi:hypothetical protein